MAYGTITENEAVQRGLMQEARAAVQEDGRVMCFHDSSATAWWPKRELAQTAQPLGWKGGVWSQEEADRQRGLIP